MHSRASALVVTITIRTAHFRPESRMILRKDCDKSDATIAHFLLEKFRGQKVWFSGLLRKVRFFRLRSFFFW